MLEEAFDTIVSQRETGQLGETENGLALTWVDEEARVSRSVHAFERQGDIIVEYTVWRDTNSTRHWTKQELATLHDNRAEVLVELLRIAFDEVEAVTEADLTETEPIQSPA